MKKCADCKNLNYGVLDCGKGLCLHKYKTIEPWEDDAKTLRATFCRGYEANCGAKMDGERKEDA